VQWNQWLDNGLGQLTQRSEQQLLENFLNGTYGKHAVLIGLPRQIELIKALDLPCHLLLTSLPDHQKRDINTIESNLHELPIASGSVDLVILPHILELVDNPRQLLSEACRIVKPEGHLIICGFNLYSLWGLTKVLRPKNEFMPKHHYLHQGTLKKWLHLSDFELVKQSQILYRPPVQNAGVLNKLQFMEWLGNQCHLPWGAIYVLMAQAKVLPLTPIRLRWKQRIPAVSVPTSIPGPTARNSN